MPHPLLLSTPFCLMDHWGLDRGIYLLPTMPWPCWCSAHSSSLPPSAWWIMEVWIVIHDYYQLFIHSVISIECVLTLICPSVHMASVAPVHPGERSSSVALLKVSSLCSPWRVVWEFFLIRCEVLGQGCLCVQIVKPSLSQICENGLYKINWIGLK